MYTPTFRSSKTRVPILSKEEIDEIGESLIQDFCPESLETPTEIDIDRFLTRYLSMVQDFQYLSHCGVYLGMTVFNDTDRIPVFNPQLNRAEFVSAKARTVIIDNGLLEEKQEHRYRFTVGHEASHGILHPGYFGYDPNQMSIFAQDKTPMIQCRADNYKGCNKPVCYWTDSDRMEWQANRLASAILMPKCMVIETARSARFLSNSANAALEEVVSVFNEAAYYRLQDLSLIPKNAS